MDGIGGDGDDLARLVPPARRRAPPRVRAAAHRVFEPPHRQRSLRRARRSMPRRGLQQRGAVPRDRRARSHADAAGRRGRVLGDLDPFRRERGLEGGHLRGVGRDRARQAVSGHGGEHGARGDVVAAPVHVLDVRGRDARRDQIANVASPQS